MDHTAINMARLQVPGMLRAELLWPFDCQRRCHEMVRVARGPAVAEELTRNLRPWAKAVLQERWA